MGWLDKKPKFLHPPDDVAFSSPSRHRRLMRNNRAEQYLISFKSTPVNRAQMRIFKPEVVSVEKFRRRSYLLRPDAWRNR